MRLLASILDSSDFMCYNSIIKKVEKGSQTRKEVKMTFTINTLPTEYANKIVCCFCSTYTTEFFCSKCNEYKGLMTLAEFMTTYEISEWEE